MYVCSYYSIMCILAWTLIRSNWICSEMSHVTLFHALDYAICLLSVIVIVCVECTC